MHNWNFTGFPWLFLSALLVAASPAAAYIGPGAGAGTIAVILGIFASVFIALFAVIWYPMKRWRKNRSARRAAKTAGPDVQ